MSGISTLRNNIDLIFFHQEEIQYYVPYKFSRLVIRRTGRIGGQWYEQNMFMGAYLDVWSQYLPTAAEPKVLPLYIASGMFGAIFKYLGLSLSDKSLVRKAPRGMTTGVMRNPMWAWIQANPVRGLGVPLAQLVTELKEGKPVAERASYQLLHLRELFYQAVSAISGIRHDNEKMGYRLVQGVNYQLCIEVDVVISVELSPNEMKQLVFGGSAVELNDILIKTREDLFGIANKFGFPLQYVRDSRTAWARLKFARQLAYIDEVLATDTVTSMCQMLHAIQKRIRRL